MGKYLVCIDPGHGGRDPGAVNGVLKEKDFTLAISLKVAKLLKHNNIDVILTRDKDVYVGLNGQRTPICDINISIHVNSGGGEGLETWVALVNKPEQSKKLGNLIQRNILKLVLFKDRGLKTSLNSKGNADYLYMIRNARGVPVLIECGFIDNTNDMKLLQNNIDKIAEGIAKGICEYLGVSFKMPKESKYFKDVQDHWAIGIIDRVSELGIMGGYPDGSFKPDKTPTRAELATALLNLYRKLGGR